MTLTFKFGRYFCTMHLTAKFHRPTFNRSEVIVLTNKQTDKLTNKQTPLKTSTSLRCATPVGKIVQACKQRHLTTSCIKALLAICYFVNTELNAQCYYAIYQHRPTVSVYNATNLGLRPSLYVALLLRQHSHDVMRDGLVHVTSCNQAACIGLSVA